MEHPSVSDELRALEQKMRDLAEQGQYKIDCTVILSALIRINEAHHAEIEEIRTDIISSLRSIQNI